MEDEIAAIRARHEAEDATIEANFGVLAQGWATKAHADRAVLLARVAELEAALTPPAAVEDGWQPIETAPKDQDVLVYWPQHATDEDGCLTDQIVGGVQIVSRQMSGSGGHHGMWDEPDWISGHGLHMDDDWCWAQFPTHWRPLPTPPATITKDTP